MTTAPPLPRVRRAAPDQVVISGTLDELLPNDHPVRAVRAFVDTLDLADLYADIRAFAGHAGAPAIDPPILFTFWLFATIEGVGSARALADLGTEHLAFQWIAGGVHVGYHTLADFRVERGAAVDRALTDVIAVLLHEDLIELKRVAQDGMRVRADAGASSFRRGATIAACQEEARQQVEALQAGADEDPGAGQRRAAAAQQRAARERAERLTQAQQELKQLQEVNDAQPKSRQKAAEKVRASTTDPECRRMKMADGGTRPGYNVQYAATTVGGVIVGVAVTNEGTDGGQMTPMLAQIEARCGQRPEEYLVDGGFNTVEGIDAAEQGGTKVYAPVKSAEKQLAAGKDPYQPKKSDTEATAAWRARMGTAAAKEIYKERASTAELVNAGARNRGLYQVAVRGQKKVLAQALWQALAHNFLRLQKLRADKARDNARRAEQSAA